MKARKFRYYPDEMFMKGMNLMRFSISHGDIPAAYRSMAFQQAFG